MKEFSLLGFVEHIGQMTVAVAVEEHEALEEAAKLIEKTAKDEIGHYQSGGGPFAGWAELADTTKDDRVRLGYSENDPGLRSGDMRDSIGHQVHVPMLGNGEAVVGSDDDKLVYFEIGTPNQPPRSVLGLAAHNKADEAVEILGAFVIKALVGDQVFGGRLPIP